MFNSIINGINNASFEKHGENRAKICPETTSDVELDVVFVDIDKHIDSVYCNNLTASSVSLGFELEAKSDVDFFHVNFNVAFSLNKGCDLVAEMVALEGSSELFAVEVKSVV